MNLSFIFHVTAYKRFLVLVLQSLYLEKGTWLELEHFDALSRLIACCMYLTHFAIYEDGPGITRPNKENTEKIGKIHFYFLA